MELMPAMRMGWLNGWILVCLLFLTYGIVLKLFPKEVVARLYDKSGRGRRDKAMICVGAVLAAAYFLLIIVTPLKLGSGVLVAGLAVYVLGLAGFLTALIQFRNTPPGEPVTGGLYRLSRHPQQLSFFVIFLGVSIAVGSWLVLLIQAVSALFLHARVLAEERACLQRYGDSYRSYMKRVPRYLLFY
jgi:protein-S-isoprenylcysteine O-methyltransferase Ste14